MRKISYSILLLFMFSIPPMLYAQDLNEIVMQKCLNFSELEKYTLMSESNLESDKIYVLDIHLPDLKESKILSFGKNVEFIERDEVCNQKIDNYFVFHTYLVDDTSINIIFHNYYNENGEAKILEISPVFEKKGGEWIIIETKLKNI